MIKYVFKDGPIAIRNADKADPQRIGQTLADISEKNQGKLSPYDVLAEARSPHSPLHNHFEWDDTVAAQKYRVNQAREIIRIIRVQEDQGPIKHAFLSIRDEGSVSYRSAQEVSLSSKLRAAVLLQAERDLDAWLKRYQDLKEICAEVMSARDKVRQRRKEGISPAH